MKQRDGNTERSRDETATNGGVNRRRVLQASAGTGIALAGIGGTGSVAAQEESADEGYIDACLGGLEDAADDFPEVSVVGYSRPEFLHKYGEEGGDFPHGEDEILVYTHGWIRDVAGGAKDQAATLKKALRQNGYDHPVVAAIWSANSPNWWSVHDRAEEAGVRLADWIREYRSQNPDTTIRLVSHSVGAHVFLKTCTLLAGEETIETLAMLSGGTDVANVCADGRFADGITETAEEVHSYHSENDNLLCSVYRLGEFGGKALGCGGSECGDGGWFSSPEQSSLDNYVDIDVTDQADGHCSYYRPDGQGVADLLVENFDQGTDVDDGGSSDDGGWFDLS